MKHFQGISFTLKVLDLIETPVGATLYVNQDKVEHSSRSDLDRLRA